MKLLMNFLLLLAVASFTQGHRGPRKCQKKLEISPGKKVTITSPNFPRFYQFGRGCNYEIDAGSTSTFNIECQTFNLRPFCNFDYLAIMEDRIFPGFYSMTKFCGSETVSYSVETDVLRAAFISRGNRGYKRRFQGFSCTVSLVENSESTSVGDLTSPTTDISAILTSEDSAASEASTESGSSNVVEPEPTPRCSCGKNALSTRIVNGNEADLNEYPWQAMLRSGGEHYCGGTLISEKCVLTAAHCVEGMTKNQITVTLGDHQKNTNTETESIDLRVDTLIMHPDYNPDSIDNDIALLCFASPVTLTDEILPACLPYDNDLLELDDRNGTVTGWGTTSSGGRTSEVLNELDIPILSTETCRTYRYPARQITDNMICTYEQGKDSCQGDSGGPLVTEKNDLSYVVGVVSWGNGCANDGYPGVYTKVNNYLDWIEANTGETFCQP